MTGAVVGFIFGIILGFCFGNDKLRHKIFEQVSKLMQSKPNKGIALKGGSKEKCKFCDNGIQTLNTGLKVECPVCKGKG